MIVRGPLGSGKTTLSELLASSLGGARIAIDRILEEQDLEQWDEDCISEESFLRANVFAARQAEELLLRQVPAIVDGNFYWRSAIEDLVRRLPFPHVVFTLKVPLELCVSRDAGRSPSYGPEAAREVYGKTTAFDYGVLVDATGTASEAAKFMLEELRRNGMPGA